MCGGVCIAMASISERSSSANGSCVAKGISSFAAISVARCGLRLQSPTTFQPAARNAGAETRVPQPVPKIPTRSVICLQKQGSNGPRSSFNPDNIGVRVADVRLKTSRLPFRLED